MVLSAVSKVCSCTLLKQAHPVHINEFHDLGTNVRAHHNKHLLLAGFEPATAGILLVAVSCSLFCISAGCTYGFSAILLPQLKQDENFIFSDSYDAWIASSACLAMAFGCIIGGIMSDKFGRKFTHLALTVPFIIGWIVISFANDVTLLIVGRIITGVGAGAFRSLGAVYLGEITNPKDRPFFIFSLSISGTSGILLSHLAGGYLNWKYACYIICAPPAIGFVLQLFLHESPLWLIYKGKIDEGSKKFTWFRGDDECSKKELTDILEKHTDGSKELTFKEKLRAMFSPAFLKPLVTTVLMFSTVQFCGVNTISFYALDLMKDTFADQDPFILMLATDVSRVVGVALLFTFSSYLPRRKSYVIICALVELLLVALIAYIAIKPRGLAWLAMTGIMIYLGLGSILIGLCWAFIGEIFPSKLRGLGSGIGASSSFFLLFLAVVITPIISKHYGLVALYSTFAVISLFSLTFLYVLLPQSDGKTLQEIENSYAKK